MGWDQSQPYEWWSWRSFIKLGLRCGQVVVEESHVLGRKRHFLPHVYLKFESNYLPGPPNVPSVGAILISNVCWRWVVGNMWYRDKWRKLKRRIESLRDNLKTDRDACWCDGHTGWEQGQFEIKGVKIWLKRYPAALILMDSQLLRMFKHLM